MKRMILLALLMSAPAYANQQLVDEIVKQTALKTCNVKLIEMYLEKISKLESKEEQKRAISAINRNCASTDEILAISLTKGIDPTLISETAAGGVPSGPVRLTPGGFSASGAGSGSGANDLASGS
jgi:hypothetical protein